MNLARAMEEGFRVVRHLGNTITPEPMVTLSRLPTPAAAALLWGLSRVDAVRKTGAAGPSEPARGLPRSSRDSATIGKKPAYRFASILPWP